jgi:hypothetical protein
MDDSFKDFRTAGWPRKAGQRHHDRRLFAGKVGLKLRN